MLFSHRLTSRSCGGRYLPTPASYVLVARETSLFFSKLRCRRLSPPRQLIDNNSQVMAKPGVRYLSEDFVSMVFDLARQTAMLSVRSLNVRHGRQVTTSTSNFFVLVKSWLLD